MVLSYMITDLVYHLEHKTALIHYQFIILLSKSAGLVFTGCFSQVQWQMFKSKSELVTRLGNPKAAAQVAVRPSVLVTVKC